MWKNYHNFHFDHQFVLNIYVVSLDQSYSLQNYIYLIALDDQKDIFLLLFRCQIIMNLLSYFKGLFSQNKSMSKYSKQELKKRLSPLQYKVTQQNGTQPPYSNEYNKVYKKGIYNCIVCFKPLFSSQTKYDSGCGWPAFYDELKDAKIAKKVDYAHGMVRTEVRCSECDSHLGHIFQDGPQDKTGVRYCINSASVKLQEKP